MSIKVSIGALVDPYLFQDDTASVFTGTISASQVIYNGASPAQFAVGDSPVWAVLAGETLQDITQEERVWYVEPTFSAFALASFAPWSLREVGNSYVLSWSQTFTWTTTTPSNVAVNSIAIRDMSAWIDRATGLADDGSEAVNIGTVTFNPASPSTLSQQWRIQGLDTNALAFNRLYTVSTQFVYPTFRGVVNNISDIFTWMTRAQMTSLPMSTVVVPEQSASFTTSPSTQRYAIAYPASYGSLVSIIDQNNFNTLPAYTTFTFNLTSMLNGATVPYIAYILTSPTTQTSFTNTYNF